MRHKIKTSYKQNGDARLIILANRILQSMNNNSLFPNPTPAYPELEKAVQEFNLAVSGAGRNDRTRISDKNDKKVVLVRLLTELALYVESICQGDKTKLLSSGFDITGEKSGSGLLAPITQFVVQIDAPGQATTRVNKVSGARSYVHQYTPDPVTSDSVWVSETITDRQHTFNNLPSITKVWFRVIAVGKGKLSNYSPPVARVIQ